MLEQREEKKFVAEPVKAEHLNAFTKTTLKIPILGRKMLEKKVKEGFVVAEVIMPNQTSMYYLIDTRFNVFTYRVSDKKEKIFLIHEVKKNPEKYVRYLNGIPVITFNWKTGLPVPIDPQQKIDWDEDYLNDIIMRARLVGGTEKLIDWLNQTLRVIQFSMLLSGATLAILLMRWLGFITW